MLAKHALKAYFISMEITREKELDLRCRALVTTLPKCLNRHLFLWPTIETTKIVHHGGKSYVMVMDTTLSRCLTVFRITDDQLRKISRIPKPEQDSCLQKVAEL